MPYNTVVALCDNCRNNVTMFKAKKGKKQKKKQCYNSKLIWFGKKKILPEYFKNLFIKPPEPYDFHAILDNNFFVQSMVGSGSEFLLYSYLGSGSVSLAKTTFLWLYTTENFHNDPAASNYTMTPQHPIIHNDSASSLNSSPEFYQFTLRVYSVTQWPFGGLGSLKEMPDSNPGLQFSAV